MKRLIFIIKVTLTKKNILAIKIENVKFLYKSFFIFISISMLGYQ